MKKLLPILLVVCTVLLLTLNIFAGSEGGARIAVIKKNTGTINMTDATVKEAVFNEGSATTTITATTGATSVISAAWDDGAIYFYIDVTDENLGAFIQRYATETGKTDVQVASDYQQKVTTARSPAPLAATTDDPLNPGHTVKERTDAENARGAYIPVWLIPSVEIMIDATNVQGSAWQTSKVHQGRVAFDGYKMSYIPVTDKDISYNMWTNERFEAVCHTKTTTAGAVTGYQVKMKFPAANLGVVSFEDWAMVSVHPFMRFANESGAIETAYASFEEDTVRRNDWDAPNYSYYRLWDPASSTHTGANASEVAGKYTETSISSTTSSSIGGIVPASSSTSSSTQAPGSSETPGTSSSTQAPAATTPAPGTTAAPADEGGCGSVIGGVIAAFAATAVAVPVVILRKKDEQ